MILGKPEAIDHVLVALLAGHHLLMEDVPGVGKTTLAKALARCFSGEFRRVQFTPDLLPADILGLVRLQPARRELHFQGGAGLRPRAAGRRDQPGLAAHAVGAPRGDERGAGLERRRDAAAALALPRPRHAEPRRVPRHLPAARGAARPLRDADRPRLPGGRARGGRALQPGRAPPARVGRGRALRRRRGGPPGRGPAGAGRALARPLRGGAGRGHATALRPCASAARRAAA